MGKLRKLWKLFPAKQELASELSRKLNISEFIAQALINRGLKDEKAAKDFIYAGFDNVGNPYLLKDMDIAVDRIKQAIKLKEKITVYGDYDVDGITSCTVLYKTLNRLDANVEFYIPDRHSEGYGLNAAAIKSLINAGTKLIITVDCGISSYKEIADVAGRLDVIVTDHHQPPPDLPPALAVINPKQPGCLYPEKNLAGVGVAFKLCQALWQKCFPQTSPFFDYLDIVAIGTIADIVPLTGENRAIVKLGLELIQRTDNIGLRALLEVCGLSGKKIDSGSVGFGIAPRLNAVGRVSQAAAGVNLLLTEDESYARELASLLEAENSARQVIEKEILAKAEEQLATIDLASAKVLVLAGENWHSGVIGIVASRLVERYFKPVVMISVQEEYGKGSCRSIPAFDIYSALNRCSDLLTQFGGHRQAAGLTIPVENIEILRTRLNEIASQTLQDTDYLPVLNIDSMLPLKEINAAFVEELACLEPYGFGNPSPVFACRNVRVSEKRRIGQQSRHLKLKLKNASVSDVIAWNMGELSDSLNSNEDIDLVFVPKYNEWQGQKNVQLTAQDIRHSLSTPDIVARLNEVAPDRDCVSAVYLTVKKLNQQGLGSLTIEEIAAKVKEYKQLGLSGQVIEKSLTVLTELNLISVQIKMDNLINISFKPMPQNKLNLTDSPTFCDCVRLREELLDQDFS